MRRSFTTCVVAGALACASVAHAGVTEFGGMGTAPGDFGQASSLAVENDGSVVVSDEINNQLLHYGNDGSYLGSVGSTGSATTPLEFNLPNAVAVEPSGDVLVADSRNGRVDVLGADLSYLRSVSVGGAQQVAADASSIYVVSEGMSGRVLSKFSNDANLTAEGSLSIPYGTQAGDISPLFSSYDQMAVDGAGEILVDDNGNHRVLVFGASLTFLRSWTQTGSATGVAVGNYNGAEQVYTGNLGPYGTQAQVLRENAQGTQEGSFGPIAGGAGFLPSALATDSSGDVFALNNGGSIFRISPTPEPMITAAPASGFASQTPTFGGSTSSVPFWSIDDFRWDLDGSGVFASDTGAIATISRRFDQPGTYPIGLRVATTNGQAAQTSMNYVVAPSSAHFLAPSSALTGASVALDASGSVIPLSSVTDYAWDFDGAGGYAVDGGTSPLISHQFATPGTYSVQLRVTRTGGRVDVAQGTIIVTPHPPSGPVGASINNGDFATNNPHVQVGITWPSAASQALLSNDGGFKAAGRTATRTLAEQVPWTLDQTGPERLPKTVYVRFLGAASDQQTFTDDIILDQTSPTLQSAQVVAGPASSAGVNAAQANTKPRRPKIHSYRIKIKAQDKIVGVCAVAASPRKSRGTVVNVKSCHRRGVLRLAKTVTIKSRARPKYVRVRNSARGWSRWHKVRG